MKSPIQNQILNRLGHVYDEITKANRHDRLKALERENELLRGNQEETDRRMKAMERYLGIEYIREADYKLIKKNDTH